MITIPNYEMGGFAPTAVQMWAPTSRTSGAWVTIPGLYVNSLRLGIQPNGGISSSTLVWHWGEMVPMGQSTGFQKITQLGAPGSPLQPLFGVPAETVIGILQRPIRIQKFNPNTGLLEHSAVHWIQSIVDKEFKEPVITDNAELYGNQELHCSGPEWLLNRNTIDRSYVEGYAGDPVPRGLAFNLDPEGKFSPNKNPDALEFAEDLRPTSGVEPWSGTTALEYLFNYFAPGYLNEITPGDAHNWQPPLNWEIYRQDPATRRPEVRDRRAHFVPSDQRTRHTATHAQLVDTLCANQRFAFWYLSALLPYRVEHQHQS